MSRTPSRRLRRALSLMPLALAAVMAVGLTACGGNGATALSGTQAGPTGTTAQTVRLSGVAATGAAIGGATVKATNAKGASATGTTGADGSYTIDIADGAPYILQVKDNTGKDWYSYAPAAGTAHINPMTTLAMLQANGSKPLDALTEQWASAPLSQQQVLDAAKKVNANLASVMRSKSVDASTTNIFSGAFTANHTGMDAVLDAMRVSYTCNAGACTHSIRTPAGETLVTWKGDIDTTGVQIQWATSGSGGSGGGTMTVGTGSCKAPQAGTWSMIASFGVDGFGGVALPEVCVDGLPGAPSSQAEFCGGTTVTQQVPSGASITSCTFSGNTGTIVAQITSPMTITYTVKYTFVKH